jgi:hypothetical protein
MPIMILFLFLAFAKSKRNQKIMGFGFLTPAISELVTV